MNITAKDKVDLYTIRQVMTSNKISDSQKVEYIRRNRTEIKNVLSANISGAEFKGLMKNRPLQKFKPIKNSFTKRGDKVLLAKTLEIEPAEVDNYIESVEESLEDLSNLSFLPKDKIDAIKTYVYRHGNTDGIVAFLDYELKYSTDILKTLYRTLDYHTGGLADYFIRPIHRMSNNTMVRLYNVIDKNITNARNNGTVSYEESNEIARWALVRIYQIQNNSKFINAVKTFKELNS
jgi:hypothetical protein